ncbi:MAG: HAD family hydrolase [Burkholderiaceae bacterium]
MPVAATAARTAQALLFDLDGTLIHSMPLHHEAWRQWHAGLGLPFDDDGFFEATAGRTNAEILRDLFPAHTEAEREGMAEAKEAIYRSIAAQRLQMVDGALAFLQASRDRGLKLAICTASPPGNMAVAFARFGLDAMVDAITSPSDGLRGKPHPDIFAEAARQLQVDAAHCVVFEDAPLGVEAARRAGMRAFALTTTLGAPAFDPFDNLIGTASDFAALHIDTLLQGSCHA